VPCDFIGFCQPLNPLGRHHDLSLESLFVRPNRWHSTRQKSKLKPMARRVPHRTFEGNRLINTILAGRLTPATLGSLVALRT
jgi:glucose-6-phosphate isomerase